MATAADDNLELLNKDCNLHLSLTSHGIKHFEVIVLGHSLREGFYHDTTSCHGNAWRRGRPFLLCILPYSIKGKPEIIGKAVLVEFGVTFKVTPFLLHVMVEILVCYR